MVRVVLATAISAAFVVFFATRLDLPELAGLLSRVDVRWLLVSIALFGATNCIRAERFRLLDKERHYFFYWWVATQLYNFMTSTLPGGMGEIATSYLFRRSSYAGWAGAFRLLVVARLFDMIALLSIFVAAMCALGLAWTTPSGVISCGVSAALIISVLIVLIPQTQAFMLSLAIRFLPKRFPPFAKARNTLQAMVDFPLLTNRRTSMLLVAWSAAIGVVSAGLVTALLAGFGTHLSLLQSCASYGLYVLLQLIPLQGMAGVGTQSARWVVALLLVGVTVQNATLDSVAMYVCLYVMAAMYAAFAILGDLALRSILSHHVHRNSQ